MKVQREANDTRGQTTAIFTREHPGHPQCPCLIQDTESDDLGDQLFASKNGKLSEFKMFSTTTDSNRTIDELDGDTTVWFRCIAPDARTAGGASFRDQTTPVGWRGFGSRTMRSALGAHLSVDTQS